jgi:hypothetical protein
MRFLFLNISAFNNSLLILYKVIKRMDVTKPQYSVVIISANSTMLSRSSV